MPEPRTPSSGSALKLAGVALIIIVGGGLLYAVLGDVEENPAALRIPLSEMQ